MAKTKDLTVGKPFKLILNFALPVFVGLVLQQIYSLVDLMIVGRNLGSDCFDGVGVTGAINFLVIGMVSGLCAGFAIPIAQKFGSKDYDGLSKYVANSIYITIFFSIIITLLSTLFLRQILQVMNTPEYCFTYAYNYIFIIFAGIPTIFLYNLTSNLIRSLGDSKTPLYFLAISSALNIILDLLFIVAFKMSVEGAAYATIISQFVSGVLCLIILIKKYPLLKFNKRQAKFSFHRIKKLFYQGFPMGLQYSITAIGAIILQTAINGLEKDYITAIVVANKINGFFVTPFDALGSTMATYGGQNIGAKSYSRISKGFQSASIMGAIYSVIGFVILYFFATNFTTIFLSGDEINQNVLDNIHVYFIYIGATYFLLALVNISRFLIQGMGFSFFAIIAGVLEMIARALAAIILVPRLGYVGACLGGPLAWLLADMFLVPAVFICNNKLKKNAKKVVNC